MSTPTLDHAAETITATDLEPLDFPETGLIAPWDTNGLQGGEWIPCMAVRHGDHVHLLNDELVWEEGQLVIGARLAGMFRVDCPSGVYDWGARSPESCVVGPKHRLILQLSRSSGAGDCRTRFR